MLRKIVPFVLGLLCFIITSEAQPIISISNASANNGETVSINVTMDNYVDYISLEFSIVWDADVISYESVSNLTNGLPGFTQQSSINVVQNTLNVVWFESNLTPTTLPNGTNLFTITFEVTGDPCDSTGLNVPNVEIVDENEEIAATVVNPGYVSVPGTGCGTFDGLRIIGETKTVSSGSPVCIKFTSEGFDNVIAGQYTITFNPSVIEYTGIQNINWPDLAEGTTFTSAQASSGILRVVWSDPNAQAISIADGTVLYELCFTAIGSGGQMSQIGFSNNPTMIEFADGNSDPIAFQGVPGKVNIEGEIEGFALIFPNIEAQPGEEVCVPITVNDFIDIVALGASINWDSTILEFVRFEGFNLPDLDQNVVSGPEAPGNNGGQAAISWIDNTLGGITVANGTEILRICFNVIGVCDEVSPVSFTSDPLILEVEDVNGQAVPITAVDGSVTINCDACGASVVNVTHICAGGELGSIDISVTGGCEDPITYAWSNGQSTQDIVAPAGEYVVTITVGGNTFIILDTITILILDPIQVSANITDSPNGNDGAISLTVTGGEPGYTFLWSNNAQTQNISGLAPGQYTVTITDSNGCTFIAGPFTVNSASAIVAAVTNVDCFGSCTGSINITAVNCVSPPLSYQWSNSLPPVPMVVNLCAGTYSVTVTGSGGATCTASFTVSQPPSAIVVSIDTTNESGNGNNGAIDLTVSGGQGPYTYQWSNGLPGTEDQTGLSGGTYTVTITDQFGCDVVRTIQVFGISLMLNITGSSYNGAGVSCSDACDGEVFVVAVNGAGNITYQWSSGGTTQVITDRCAGTYTVTVTDGLGRSSTASYTLTAPDALIVQVQIECASEPGVSDGSAFAQVSGGTGPYHYLWNNGSHDAALQNVAAGPYLLIVTDNNACQVMQRLDVCIEGIECYEAISVITPNDDGKNDLFTINCINNAENTLSIYNRYGGLEFEMDNYDNSWQGTDQEGNILSDGGYHWVLQVMLPNGDREIYKGTVSLVRSLD